MCNWIRALALMLPLSVAFPALASTITGADGPLAPAADYTLPYRADGVFDFSVIDLGAGITLRFDPHMQNVTLLSLGDIRIAGAIDAIGGQLALETPGQIVVTGAISAGSISLAANAMTLTGNLQIQCLEDCAPTLIPPLLRPRSIDSWQLLQGGDVRIRASAVPEPATLWLIALLLPALALLGRKRTGSRQATLLRAC